jgi:N-acetylglucosamine-6-phosphate deacetylase
LTTRVELLVDAVAVIDDALVDAWIAVAGGSILAVGERRETPPRADICTTLGGAMVLPGFIDIHVHGGGGDSFGADQEANERVAAFHLRHGTTALLPTLVTAEPAAMLQAVEAVGCARESGAGRARILGAHLEGPFISPSRRGAHDPALIRPPVAEELERLSAAGDGRVRLVTAAPELAGFPDLAQAAERSGVRVAAGHTDASGEQLLEAVSGGVVSLTHTFNAMRTITQRDPGAVQAIADTDVFCEVICDGIHVHPAMIRMLRSLAGPDRVVLVTDASQFAGRPDGDYITPRRSVGVHDGAVRLAGTETLAGSTLTMLAAAKNYLAYTGVSLTELAAATSRNAARLLGEQDRLGRIQPRYASDLVVLDEQLECLGVMSSGTWVSGFAVPAPPASVSSETSARVPGAAYAR